MKRAFLVLLIGCCSALAAVGQTGYFYPSDRFSSSLIAEICQDKYGRVWIGTDYGLNRFDGYMFETFLHDDNDSCSICDNAVVSMLCDKDGNFWVGTSHGLDRFDEATASFIHYAFPDHLSPRVSCLMQLSNDSILVATAGYGAFTLGSDGVLRYTSAYTDREQGDYYSCVFEDSHGRVWKTAYDNSVIMREGNSIKKFQSMGEPMGIVERDDEVLVFGNRGITSYRNGSMDKADIEMGIPAGKELLFSAVEKDGDGNIYIGTRGSGLYCIPSGKRKMERVSIDIFGTDLNTAKVWTILSDRRGNIWLGLQRKGLVFIPRKPMTFSNWSFQAQNINLGSSISSVCEGDGGITWCTVQGVGVYGFDAHGHVVAHPAAPNAVEMIFHDSKRRYWVGTDDGLFAYNPLTGASTQKISFDCDKFNDMTCDNNGNLYISAFSRGFLVYNPETGDLKNYRNVGNDSVKVGHLCNDWIMCMTPDRQGMIWMGTSSGVSCFDPATQSFLTQGWLQQLDGIMCFSICELRDGNIALGTAEGLYLYDRHTRRAELFPNSEELRNKVISYIVQSNDGDIWCATSMGIWQYNANEEKFIGHVNGNGLTKKEYLYGVGIHTDADVVYFGNNDGLTVFKPAEVNSSKPSADEVELTAFLVGRTNVNTLSRFNDVQVTDRAVIESDHFTLSYLDHTVTLAFSQLNYENPANVSFEYKVNKGDWIHKPEGENEFTLNHLQPGTYKVMVRALSGNVYSPEKEITITIRAPWYRTRLARLLYLLVILALGAYVFFTYRRRTNQQLNEEKMKFLINATHDIRSPLTLIMSPLTNLKRRLSSEQSEAMRDVDTIEHNANRILNLVNQILDVRKIDKQQLHLHCQETDMVSFVSSICMALAYQKKAAPRRTASRAAQAGHVAGCNANQFASATSGPASSFRKKRRPGIVGIQLDVTQREGP